MPVLHHILLAAAALALGGAGLRVASLAAAGGLERVLAAAALAVAAAVVEVLALGLVGLGGSSIALALAAGLTWVAARRVRAPTQPVRAELAQWWGSLAPGSRIAVGALAGAFAVWQAWLLAFPTLGFDTVLYHLSESVVWAGSGHTAETELVIRRIPVTNYPITAEVLLSWGLGLSRSLVPASLLVPPHVALAGVAAWCGLRNLEVPPLPRILGTAAICGMPAVIGWQSNGALTDPVALAWLLTCAALCAAARSRPALLAPALVAAGLAVGTKTTTAPLVLALLVGLGWLHRSRLRAMWRPLAAAVLLAAGCGGVWYLRNLLLHGSPLWPFVEAPWGTPLPPAMESADDSFLAHPRETVQVVGDLYLSRFLGGIVLLSGAVAAPLLAPRRRAVWVASAATAVSVLIWARAPFTGVPPLEVRIPEGVFSTTRYLVPAVAAAVVALALAARGSDWRARVAQLVLLAGLVVELVQGFRLGFPAMPSPFTPLVGAALGALAVWAATRLSRRVRVPEWLGARPALVAGALAAGALLALPAGGYLSRHAGRGVFASAVADWMARQPADARPVASAPVVLGPLSGDRLRRRLVPIPPRESCRDVRARARRGYVVLYVGPPPDDDVTRIRRCMGRPPAHRDDAFQAWAPEP